MSEDSTTPNEPPMNVYVVDEHVINQWYDYWSDQRYPMTPNKIIERLRRLTLAGASKARRNQKAIAAVLADVFDGMAADARAGRIKVRTFTKWDDNED